MSEKTDVWMPLFIGDYLRDTNRLTTEQHGAYLLLIMDYWTNGAPPDDDEVLASITRLSTAAWKKARPAISRLFRISDDAWHHKRIEEELKNAAENSRKNTDRAKKAAAKRWQKHSLDDATSNAQSNTQEVLDKCPSPSPSPSPSVKPSEQPPLHPEPESREKTADVAAAIPDPPTTEGHWLTWFNRETGSNFDPGSRFDRDGLWPIFRRWCDSGIRQGQVKAAIDTAYATATTPIANLPKYVAQVLSNSQAPPRISHSDKSKLAAARAIFGTEIEGEIIGTSERTIEAKPTAKRLGG